MWSGQKSWVTIHICRSGLWRTVQRGAFTLHWKPSKAAPVWPILLVEILVRFDPYEYYDTSHGLFLYRWALDLPWEEISSRLQASLILEQQQCLIAISRTLSIYSHQWLWRIQSPAQRENLWHWRPLACSLYCCRRSLSRMGKFLCQACNWAARLRRPYRRQRHSQRRWSPGWILGWNAW